MREIPLTQGKVALVDDEDFEKVSQHKWKYNKNNTIVTYSPRKEGEKNHNYLCLSVFLFGIKKNITRLTFMDGNKLNYCRKNIVVINYSDSIQGQNRKKSLKRTSVFVGVSWHKKGKKWQATIELNEKSYYLGLFDKELEAAAAYNKKAVELYGPNAKLNPLPLEES